MYVPLKSDGGDDSSRIIEKNLQITPRLSTEKYQNVFLFVTFGSTLIWSNSFFFVQYDHAASGLDFQSVLDLFVKENP